MYMIAFYYKHHPGLLEVMFDEREDAETVLKEFEQAIVKGQCSDLLVSMSIKSKYGDLVLNPDHYSGVMLTDLKESEELMVMLGVRRARVEQRAREDFESWVKTHKDLLVGGLGMPMKKSQH